MMTAFPIPLAFFILALSFTTTALGQSGDWYVAPSVIWNDDDEDRAIDDSLSGIQVNVGRNLTDHLSVEGLLGYSDIEGYRFRPLIDWYPDQSHLDLSANLLAFYDRDKAFAPYLLIGVGYLMVEGDEGPQFVGNTGSDNRPTASYGLGLKWRMGQSRYSIRGEYRARLAFGDPDNLDDRIVTLGVQYNFGGSRSAVSEPAPAKDTDGDGVLDMWDACDNTPPGVTVTSRGCPLTKVDRDDDQDRINNANDQCPNTPIGIPVDRRGCSLDSDGDGVTTDKDRCPASRTGADVDIYGCENDNDKDGVVDHRDKCLATKRGVRVDVDGCEIKDIISLPGVNFESGKDVLVAGTEYLLQSAADTLNSHSDLQIEVAGHTDNVGNADQNVGLSMRRAKTVRDFLIQFGVDENRLTFDGYGDAQPIADNGTADGRATNRRVELRLISN